MDTDQYHQPSRSSGRPRKRWWSLAILGVALLATGCNGLAFGRNVDGRLGDGSFVSQEAPVRVASTVVFDTIDAGDNHSCGISTVGALYCWGNNSNRQLGTDTTSLNQATPVRVGEETDWVSVSAGGQHTCGLRDPGTLFCWGDNRDRQVSPQIANTIISFPVPIGTSKGWTSVSAGQSHTCGLDQARRGGELRCWGLNLDGRLGNGSTVGHGRVDIGIDTADWVGVHASIHTCAIRRTGGLFCWGRNTNGQLGTGNNNPRSVPTRVGSDSDWRRIGTGERHSCGIREDGAMRCWGRNANGQVGDGSFVDRSVPTLVPSDREWDAMSVGGTHTCGIQDRRALCWGSNAFGAVGDNTNIDRGVPVLVATDLPVFRVSAGRNHTELVEGKASD